MLATTWNVMALTTVPRTIFLALSLFAFSNFITGLILLQSIGGLLVLVGARKCTTPSRANLLINVNLFTFAHSVAGLLMLEGPLLWGFLVVACAGILPLIAHVTSKSLGLSRCVQGICIAYSFALINTPLILRHFGLLVHSHNDHGLSNNVGLTFNLLCTNLTIVAMCKFIQGIANQGSILAQDQLFASISHDMRQPCHAMSLLIPLIMDALHEAETKSTNAADACRLLDIPKQDMKILGGLVDTLLTLVNDFLLFSKIRQSPGLVPPAESIAFEVCVHACVFVCE